MAVSRGMKPGAKEISNIPFMKVLVYEGMAPNMYNKPDMPKQVTFQDSSLRSSANDQQKTKK